MRATIDQNSLPNYVVDLAVKYENTQAIFDAGIRIEQRGLLAAAGGLGALLVSGAMGIRNSRQHNRLVKAGAISGLTALTAGIYGLFKGDVLQDVAGQISDAVDRGDVVVDSGISKINHEF